MHFDAMDALKLMFLLQFYNLFCSSFGAFKSHHKSHLETQESALTVYDLSSGTSAHVTVSIDSMGLGEEGGEEHYLTYLDLKSNQSISTIIRRPLRCRRVRFMLATPNTTNTHKSLFYEILQQPDTTDTTGSLILPLPPILPAVI